MKGKDIIIEILDEAPAIQRLFSTIDVSDMTLMQVAKLMDSEGIDYCGDYGFKVKDYATELIFSEN